MLNSIGFFQHFMFIVLLFFRVDFLFFARYNKSAIIKHFTKRDTDILYRAIVKS